MRFRILAGALWLAVGGLAWGANEFSGAIEKVRKCVVQVSFQWIQSNQAKRKRTTVGTVVSADGLVLISGDYLPRSEPDDRFVDFKVKWVGEKNQPELKAELVSRERDLHAALVRVTGKPKEGLRFTPAALGGVKKLEPGQPLIGYGLLPESYQYGLNFARKFVIKVLEKPQALVVVSSSAPGALFGPVSNTKGEIVGFTVQDPLYNRRGRPASVILPAERLAELLKAPGKRRKRSWLGVADLQPLSKDLAQVYGLDEKQGGVIVGRVLKGQPAAKAGLHVDDVLVKMNGKPIEVKNETDLRGFMEQLKKWKVGQKIQLAVQREKKEKVVEVTMGERPKEEAEAARFKENELGLVLRELVFYDRLGRELDADAPGLFVHYVKPGSWPSLGGLRRGDIITKIGEVELKGSNKETFRQFQKVLAELKANKKKEFMFFVSRGKKGQNSAFVKIETDWNENEKKKEPAKKK